MSTFETITVRRYRCTHCRKSWASKRTAEAHATRCWFDPANRGCKTCVHFRRDLTPAATDRCAVGQKLPSIERRDGQIKPTIRLDCDGHRVRAEYVNPDVLDALVADVS